MDKTTVIAASIAGILTTGVVGAMVFNTDEPEMPVRDEIAIEEQIPEVEQEREVEPEVEAEEEMSEPVIEVVEEPAPIVAPEPEQKTITVPAPKPAPTPSPKPVAEPQPTPACSCPVADLDCGDFSSCSQAQAVYQCCLSQGKGDWHKLDRDGDGTACDTLCR